ncbi:MAG TPA: sensor histidine kinase [Gemmatimonadales bacterium]|nr:sensor histidine kinase [Gemmatimonadales bacterium]
MRSHSSASSASSDPSTRSDPPITPVLPIMPILAFWLAMGCIETIKGYVLWDWTGRPRSWTISLLNNMPWWVLWALLTPVVFRLARRFRLTGPGWKGSVLAHGIIGLALSALHVAIAGAIYFRTNADFLLPDGRTMAQEIGIFFNMYVVLDLLTYAGVVGAFHAVEFYGRYREGELRAAQLETRMHEARLAMLRMELQPHFLFNALNAISGLVRRGDNEAAVTMLARLGTLLRRTLDGHGTQEARLGEELDLLEQYLAIERVRFGDRLDVAVEVEASLFDALVPTLVLQPIVENALRHGLASTPGPGSVRVTAQRENGSLVLSVRDSGPGFVPGRNGNHHGVGLSNTRARLEQLYGAAGRLETASAPEGGAAVRITLPLHREGERHDE